MMIAELDAIFLGTAVESFERFNDENTEIDTVFEVIESFKGDLVPRSRVLVTGAASYEPCSRSFVDGSVYLVHASIGRERVDGLRQEPRTRISLSAAFLRSGVGLTIFDSAMCHGSRRAEDAVWDVPLLRRWKAGMRKPFVRGIVNLQHLTYDFPDLHADRFPGARVSLQLGDRAATGTAGNDGRFLIEDLTDGEYDAATSAPGYREITQRRKVLVPKTGCGYYSPTLSADAGIDGIVLDHHGLPVAGIAVEALRMQEDGYVQTDFNRNANTDASGRFRLWPLPDRELVLAVHHANEPTPEAPWPRTYCPGVRKIELAKRFRPGPSEFRRDVVLILPPPASPRKVKVHVVLPDGKPVRDEMIDVFANGYHSQSYTRTDKHGQIALNLYSETEYEFRARYWSGPASPISAARNGIQVREGSVTLAPGTAPASLLLVVDKEYQDDLDW